MPFVMYFIVGRTGYYEVEMKQPDGSQLQLDATDKVRFKVGRFSGSTPTLDILSGTATANGSSVTIDDVGVLGADPATVTVRLAQGDATALGVGAFDASLSVVDDSDSDYIKTASVGVLHVLGELGGNVTLN